jgi:hypothetical protein
MPDVGEKVARRDELGTIVGIYSQQPDWFEGDWPESQPRGVRGVAVIKWPGARS